jgi:hypothetical protein
VRSPNPDEILEDMLDRPLERRDETFARDVFVCETSFVTLDDRLVKVVVIEEKLALKLAFVLVLKSVTWASTYPFVVRSDAFTGVSGLCGKMARVCFVK